MENKSNLMSKDVQHIKELIEKSDELRATQIAEREKRTSLQFKAVLKEMDAGFNLLAKELEEVKEAKQIQNSRVDKLEKITMVNKMVHDRPKLSLFLGILAYFGIAEIIKHVSISDIIKRLIG